MSSGIEAGSGWAADMRCAGRGGTGVYSGTTKPGTGATSVDPRTSAAYARRRRRALHSNHGPPSSAGTPEPPGAQPPHPPSSGGSIGTPLGSLAPLSLGSVGPVDAVGSVGPLSIGSAVP